MSSVRMVFCLATALLAGCASLPLKSGFPLFASKAEKTLSAGIALYDEGKYADAIQTLQESLKLGLNQDEQVRAHKYLAFTQCVIGRERLCYQEFRETLEINPTFELSPAEAGHPIWGPVFKRAKAKKP